MPRRKLTISTGVNLLQTKTLNFLVVSQLFQKPKVTTNKKIIKKQLKQTCVWLAVVQFSLCYWGVVLKKR